MKMNRLLRFGLPILVVIIGFGLMKLLLGQREETTRRAPAPPSIVVDTETVRYGALSSDISAYGRAASVQALDLLAEVGGSLLAGDLPFRPGTRFERGDLLLRVDDRQIRLQIDSQKSELLKALATLLPEIKLDFPQAYETWNSYFKELSFEESLAPLPPTTDGKLKLYLARYNIYKLYFGIGELEIRLEKHSVIAPFAGSIVSANLREGGTVNIGGRLGSIVNLADMEVELALSVEDVPWLNRGGEVRLSAGAGSTVWTGRIKRVGGTVDTRSQTVPVFVSPDDGGPELMEGLFLGATLPGRQLEGVFRIPRKAIYDDARVYVIEEGRLSPRRVHVVLTEDESVLIDGGLAEGEELVVEIMQGVAPGMEARSRKAAQAAAKAAKRPGAGGENSARDSDAAREGDRR